MYTILLVDDEEYILRLTRRSLEKEGYRILTASNGAQALSIIESESPDAVITDVQMPKLDGKELSKAIVDKLQDNPPLLIVATSVIDKDFTDWINSLPNAKFVEKPVSMKEIALIFKNYFKNGHV